MYERLRKRMPELSHDCQLSGGDTTTSYSNGSVSSNGFWSKHRDDVSYSQLLKFWSELSPQARQELVRIDKQTLFEQARKNMYCSRCNGQLLECFLQIVTYGKSSQLEGTVSQASCNRLGTSKCQTVEDVSLTTGCNDDTPDPSFFRWGGLTTTRDGMLTLLGCYLYSKYLNGLQKVFDRARTRERERELLYPDACGGGGRGWISQGMVGYGRGHGTRETCALHTARLSVDTLVDFWSALGEEPRHSLLRMKEEDFMERLMYRFDSKRFCRDCRKNVIREFKELKELKRTKREARCTSWFCVADTSFQYEVTLDTIQADWHQNYSDSSGMYRHYEWAVGTGEGKSDILDFENVGLNASVEASGLDLAGLNACYITLRAWRMDGRCNEVSVKAHALKGQRCVHCRLVVGEGFVTINRGESIRRFFEHAEEAEEEEDDDSMDKDGNEIDGECSRPQKHAKSPELAREFLLDAATVIFKDQVEKAFREGTARQNAHGIFVSLALKLLEERILVACKDIITLENQSKLLEEEEKEKRDEEERKERRRAKEKEKKLRRKERLRSKEKEREMKCCQPSQTLEIPDTHKEEPTTGVVDDEPMVTENVREDPVLPIHEYQEEQIPNRDENPTADHGHGKDNNAPPATDQSKHPRRKPKFWKDQLDQPPKWSEKRRFTVSKSGGIVGKPVAKYPGDGFETSSRSNAFNGVNKPVRRSNGRSNCCHYRVNGRYDPSACNCYQHNDYRPKVGKSNNASTTKKVWEPMDTQKRYAQKSNQDSDANFKVEAIEPMKPTDSPDGTDSVSTINEDNASKESKSSVAKSDGYSEVDTNGTMDLSLSGNSNSDGCSSCLSEGEGNTSFSSNTRNAESSDSEDASQHSGERVGVETTKKGEDLGKELPSKTVESYEDGKKNDVTGSHAQGTTVPPPLQAQSIHFPVFQPPSVGYYHQGPVPWTAASANGGLVPFPHPNHYLFPNPFGYGSRYLQYGVGSLAPPPLLNRGQLPVYQPAPPVNLKDHTKVLHLQKVGLSKGQQPSEPAPPPGAGENGNSEKTQKGNTGFSLFHFGGPVALSNGFKPDMEAAAAAEESDGKLSSNDPVDGPHGCGKTIEEYNLFAASNGMRFPFF